MSYTAKLDLRVEIHEVQLILTNYAEPFSIHAWVTGEVSADPQRVALVGKFKIGFPLNGTKKDAVVEMLRDMCFRAITEKTDSY